MGSEDDQITRVTPLMQLMRKLQDVVECLVVIYGDDLGRKYDLVGDTVSIGRDPSNDIVIDHSSVSRRHAKIIKVKESRYVVDLHSTNGTYVNDNPVTRAKLRSGNFIKIGNMILKYLEGTDIETAYHEEIYNMTITDGLTQLYNKRYLLEVLEKEMSRAKRYKRPLSVIMVDIDFFKRLNDRYGHIAGDAVLKELGQLLSKRIRKEEIVTRYGGEEFFILLPETVIDGAVTMAESIRSLVDKHMFPFEDQPLHITISAGVAEYKPGKHNNPLDVIKAADVKLYDAKTSGRNRIEY